MTIALSGRRGDISHTTRCGLTGCARGHRARLERLPPLLHPLLDLAPPAAIGLVLEHRQEQLKRLGGGAVQVHLARIAQRQHRRIDVDLDRARRAGLRQELGPGKSGADHQQSVAAVHQVRARLRAEQADRAGDERQIVGKDRLAEQRLGDARAERLRDLRSTSSAASTAPAPIRIATFLPALSTSAALRRSASAGTSTGRE